MVEFNCALSILIGSRKPNYVALHGHPDGNKKISRGSIESWSSFAENYSHEMNYVSFQFNSSFLTMEDRHRHYVSIGLNSLEKV